MSYYQVIEEQRRGIDLSGAFLGRYQIRKELGRGAMGVVYLAEDPAIGRKVAVKTVNFQAVSDGNEERILLDRLIREARSAGSLTHQGIVTIYDIGQSDSSAYIVMEYVEGSTLLERIGIGEFTVDEVLDILDQAAAALDFAHTKGVLHRDVKPANIMIGPRGQVKLMDFGIARITAQQTIKQSMVVGTPSYMAPEQISSKPISGAGDQFSLAVIAYEMLTGRRPFASESISGLLFSIVYDDPPALRELNPGLPDGVEPALRKALSKSAADRYQTCREFVGALRGAFQSTMTIPVAAVPAPVPEPSQSAPQPVASSGPVPAAGPPIEQSIAQSTAIPAPRWSGWTLGWILAGLAIAGAAFYAGTVLNRPQPSNSANAGPVEPAPVAPHKAAQQAPKQIPSPVVKPAPAPKADTSVPRAVTDPKPEPAGTLAKLEIYTNPTGARVTAGSETCTSPCYFNLKNGEYKVTAELAGYKSEHRIMQIRESQELHLMLNPPTGTLMMSEPAGATVRIAGKTLTIPFSARVPAGRHTLEVTHNGRVSTHAITIEDEVPLVLTPGKQ